MEAVEEPIVGTVTAQNGSSTTCNGWVASAVLGTLVIDAAGDGRAHPTGKMGSFGLAADDDYQTVQAVAGGNRAAEPLPRGRHARDRAPHRQRAAHRLRASRAASSPARATRCRPRSSPRHAAVGAISFALDARRGDPRRPRTRGPRRDDRRRRRAPRRRAILATRRRARRRSCAPRTRSTSARVVVGELELGFVNEYLTAESGGERLATFPDVLATLSIADRPDHLDRRPRASATRSPCCAPRRPTSRSATASRSRASTRRSRRCSASRSPQYALAGL